MSGKNSKPTNRFHVFSPRKNKHTDINNSVMDEPLVSKTDSVGTSQAVDSQDASQAMALSPALDARLKRMEDTIGSIVPSIRQDIHELKEAQEQKFEIITDNVNKIKQELHSVKSENSRLKTHNDELSARMDRLEAYSRKNNLILYNVPEETGSATQTVLNILSKDLGIDDATDIQFEAVHYLRANKSSSSPRPLYMRMLHRADRDRIWAARRNLRGSTIRIAEDLPQTYLKARRLLLPVMKAARASEHKATFVNDKLRVEGQDYGINDLKHLPADLNPEIGCINESDDVLGFFGRYTPFSNFYQCGFTIDGHTYNCVEQYIQKSKAETLGSPQIAQKIITEENPAQQKQLGKSVKGDNRKWCHEIRYDIVNSTSALIVMLHAFARWRPQKIYSSHTWKTCLFTGL